MSIDLDSLDFVLFNPWYIVMIFTYSSALNKETKVENPVRNHVEMRAQGVISAGVWTATGACGVSSCPSEHQEGSGNWEANTGHQQSQTASSTYYRVIILLTVSVVLILTIQTEMLLIISGFPCSHITTKQGWEWREGLVQLRTEVCDMLDCWVTLPVGEVHCLPPDRLA